MKARESIELLQRRMNETIIGQEHVIDRLILGLLADGNILVEGLPGLAKTQSIKAMARSIESKFYTFPYQSCRSLNPSINQES